MDQLWSTKEVDLDIGLEMIAKYETELKSEDLETADVYNKPTSKGLTWVKQHALWLYNKIKDFDHRSWGTIQCRIKAMNQSLTNWTPHVGHIP